MTIHKADRAEALARLERVIDRQERRIAEAFRESIGQLRDIATIEALTERLEAGDAEGAVRLLRPEVTANALQPLEAAMGGAVMEGGRAAAQNQPTVIGRNGVAVDFVFGPTNPRLNDFAQRITATRIREVSNDVRAVVRDVIRDDVTRGINPRDTARRVRQSIGLTTRQEQAVQNFRRMLEERDPQALARELRDRRFDPSVRRALQTDTPLSPEQVERMTERYRERFLRHRAEVIARTEATRAVNGASRELMQSYVDQGLIAQEQIRRFWHYTRDERTRAEHRQIPALNANGVGQNQPFQTPLGPLMYPGDPSGTPENTVQCRCTTFDRVVSAELLQDEAA